MVLYAYRCTGCGPFDVRCAIAERTAHRPCPEWGAAAARIFTPPNVRQLGAGLRRALDTAGRSADRPDVVDAVPSAGARRRTPVSTDPRHARLPRP